MEPEAAQDAPAAPQPPRGIDCTPSIVRALATGNAPITPLQHAAMTKSGPDTDNIGAAINGKRKRLAMLSGNRVIVISNSV